MKVSRDRVNKFTGSKKVNVTEFEAGATLHCTGSGKILINCSLPNEAKITTTGSGSLLVQSAVGDNVTITSKGSGRCVINGSIGTGFNVSATGSGAVVIKGDVDTSARFTLQGTCKLRFNGTLCDDVEFIGGLSQPVWFEKRPSQIILDKIKHAQEEALRKACTTDNGFSGGDWGHCQLFYKQIGGFLLIEENGVRQLYKGSKIEINDEFWSLDGKVIRRFKEEKEEEKSDSFLSKVDAFSKNHPILFILLTLGTGLLWYLAQGGCYYTHTQNDPITLTFNALPKEQSEKSYYLADADIEKLFNEVMHGKSSSAAMLEKMPSESGEQDEMSSDTHTANSYDKSFQTGTRRGINIKATGDGVQTIRGIGSTTTTVVGCAIC